MTTCLGTNLCEQATGKVTLHDGEVVCNWCPEWRLECEARRLLSYPLGARREALVERDHKRGKDATDRLREVMKLIHESGKGGRGASNQRAVQSRS